MALSILWCGCASTPDPEDARDDMFQTGDAKADTFGVDDASPDGAAVLALVNKASERSLDDDVGLSTRTAQGIIAKRAELGRFTNLAELDAVPYVGEVAFLRLLGYVTNHHLFETSIRVPLIVEAGGVPYPLVAFNEEADAVGLPTFEPFTYVNSDTDYVARMASYNTRLRELANKAVIPLPGKMLVRAARLDAYNVATQRVCFIGDPDEVAGLVGARTDDLVVELYAVHAYRHGDVTWTYEEEDLDALGADYRDYDTASQTVRLIANNTLDDGNYFADDVPPCR